MIRLDEKQYRAVKKMTRAACANNDCGNCLLLDAEVYILAACVGKQQNSVKGLSRLGRVHTFDFYCSDRACSFVMWKNDRFFEQRKKAFTKAIAAALLKDGKVKIKGMYSTKTGKTFDGVVLLADTGGKYVNFRVEQNRK